MRETQIQGIGMTSQRTRERLIQRLQEEGIRDHSVLNLIRSVPRHLFVDEALAHRAYEDTALPIGQGQTISQPYIVARMTELLIQEGIPSQVLEVGTGCGYQSTILSYLVDRLYTVERIKTLLEQARRRFRHLKRSNIRTHYSDGFWGWQQYAPYDGILVTAAPASIPQELVEQLKLGARMVIPVGDRGVQELTVVTRTQDGYDTEVIEEVSFVPMLGGSV